jgi:hypothetical protein
MKKMRSFRMLPLVGALVLAGCEDTQPTAPFLDEPSPALSQEDLVALDVLGDPETVETALALADVAVLAAEETGVVRPVRDAASDQAGNARRRFQAAQQSFRDGKHRRAADESREARRMIVDAVERTGGARAVSSLVERAEDIAFTVSAEVNMCVDRPSVADEVVRLAESARESLDRGDLATAGDRAVLVEQRHRKHCRPDPDPDRPNGARIAVALGHTSVGLAARIIDEQGGGTPEQLRFLASAKQYQAMAERALQAGYPARAVHFAELATWASLKAIVLPGGITKEEVRAMVELAKSLYDKAAATNPTGVKAVMLERAKALIAKGIAMVEEGKVRGVAPLWRGAVISAWIAG